jgi:hypothetical protein
MHRTNKKYDGYEPSDRDIVINNYRLICTCSACPEQYDVFDNTTGGLMGYLRLRHGGFRADCPDVGGEIVYSSNPKGDGIFDEDERLPELIKAVVAIKNWWDKLKEEQNI